MVHRMKSAVLAALALLASGCAMPASHFGYAPGTPAGPERTFMLAEQGEAPGAVRIALEGAGWRETPDAHYRVEVGYAVRPHDIAVAASKEHISAEPLSPAAKGGFSLCARQAHVLTLSFVDRERGTVVSRGGASLVRCRHKHSGILPALARAAVPPSG